MWLERSFHPEIPKWSPSKCLFYTY
jgi:hypothetical protein